MLTARIPIRSERADGSGSAMRLVLEIDQADDVSLPPATQAFLDHIDAVRAALARCDICPDDAHALLLDVSWLTRHRRRERQRAAAGVSLGMRALAGTWRPRRGA